MLDEQAKQSLIEQFSASLDRVEDDAADAGEPVDLCTLLAEMAALKNEVRLQARQFKSALEQMQALSDVLREQSQVLLRDLERSRAQAAEAKGQAERGLLLSLLEMRDRLQAGMQAHAAWKPSPMIGWFAGTRRYARSLREGSALTLPRLDELLAGHRVRPIVAAGQALDPQSMHAVATEWTPQVAEGLVLREVRPVFDLGGGTFDVSVVNLEGDVVEVLASHGNNHLGGDDFDQELVDLALSHLMDTYQADASRSPAAMARLQRAAEAAKIAFSDAPFATLAKEYLLEHDGVPRAPGARSRARTVRGPDRTLHPGDAGRSARGVERCRAGGGRHRRGPACRRRHPHADGGAPARIGAGQATSRRGRPRPVRGHGCGHPGRAHCGQPDAHGAGRHHALHLRQQRSGRKGW